MKTRVTVTGLKAMQATLRGLPRALDDQTVQRLARTALEPVARQARSAAPRDSGELADSIVVQPVGRRSAAVGPTAPHGHLVEMGTVSMAAQPFMRPAWDTGKALSDVGRGLWTTIARAAKRLARVR